ncbi:hypothetical protein fnug_310 [Pseudomonas phage fnug]|uniref:PHIKZ265 n=7 Tax=root TaxID=1 RepID=Q8SCP7_BPDPK|nr:hypothetical protein [Pseudomonas aeruginosa]NP_803831.1 PHIKZ265 [Pseudomonas phage phiKZ]YP_009619600.1 hypothetical protein FDJ06_gp060 [Pseudomonas phage SL2]ANM45078.1 hypothetical protein KTN4_320 [Pseudomonas phage KTN4]QGK89945.1 hypothetical protein [Pseudomonas phage vB_PA32_GUMS]QJB22953.1 hypothetical protein fnug_310 [Pseudomonas phage fnug]QYV98895.1 hypothetical protein [Pseudomonas phage T2P]QYV99476.1 hypothetical protein [Pseudomonas phage U1B]QYV99566.1 hypothetical pr
MNKYYHLKKQKDATWTIEFLGKMRNFKFNHVTKQNNSWVSMGIEGYPALKFNCDGFGRLESIQPIDDDLTIDEIFIPRKHSVSQCIDITTLYIGGQCD